MAGPGKMVDMKLFQNKEVRTISLCSAYLNHEKAELINADPRSVSLIYPEAPQINKQGGELY